MSDQKRPQGIVIVAVIGFLLSALACCGSVWGIVGIATQEYTQKQLRTMQSDLPGMQGQLQFQDDLIALTKDMMPFQICFAVFSLLLVIALVASLGALLAGKAAAPKAVKVVCAMAAVFAIVEMMFAGYMQWAISNATGDMMDAAGAGDMPGMEGIMGASMAMGICMGVGWMAVKLAYYLGTMMYLSKEDVLRDYNRAASSPIGVRGE